MKILITGGAGFIGSNLSQSHLQKDDEIWVIDNLITGAQKNISSLLKNKNFHFIKADLVSYDLEVLPWFDIIYHLASPASPIQYKRYPLETLLVNSIGTYRLLEFMKKSGSKTSVIASTSEVYGDPTVHPQVESYWGNVNPVGIRSCYDEGKRFSEAVAISFVRKHKLNIRIARIFNTYGPNMEKNDGRVVSNFIIQALENKPLTIYGNGQQTRSFCYVSDLIQGLYSLATTKNIDGQIINLGSPNEKKILELAKIIIQLTKTKSKISYQPIDEDDPQRRQPDISKAKKLLNWKPDVKLEDGLKKTIKYFQERFS